MFVGMLHVYISRIEEQPVKRPREYLRHIKADPGLLADAYRLLRRNKGHYLGPILIRTCKKRETLFSACQFV